LLHPSRRVGIRPPVHQAVGELHVRSRGAGRHRGGGPVRGLRAAPRRLAGRHPVRSVLLLGEAPVRQADGRTAGRAVGGCVAITLFLSGGPPARLSAQDTSAIDRGVRVGIIYRPGVRPGLVVLPAKNPILDSVRTIIARDLDYSDRFELITLPGGDSLHVSAAAPPARAARGRPSIAATRILFVTDGKVAMIDQDGADKNLVSSTDHQAMSPAWGSDGRRFAYMEFWAGRGQLFVQDLATGKRGAVATTGHALDFTPAFSPDGKTLAFRRATDRGTDVYTVNIKDNCCLQRLTVGRFSDNLSPAYSPDSQRI